MPGNRDFWAFQRKSKFFIKYSKFIMNKSGLRNLSVYKISLLVSIIYCIIGNAVGFWLYKEYISDDGLLFLLFLLFLPYTFPWGIGMLVGMEFSVIFILIQLLLIYLFSWIFLPVGLIISKRQ